ncbi:SPOR domain-containing protein [Thioalkalivibrio sp.]|uniref:SPOR domain-containing protein n=1 Tax=Thioalkalivibrio sp. TaxID=2093813 RepID=UPI0039759109
MAGGNEPHGEDWIRSQPASHFTIQIAATRGSDAIRQHARGLAASANDDVALARVQSGGETLHALFQGRYPNAQQARAAMAELPAGIRENGPWVRRFDSIQQSMSPSQRP